MSAVALFEAKNRLPGSIDRVEAGERFVITRRGVGLDRLQSRALIGEGRRRPAGWPTRRCGLDGA